MGTRPLNEQRLHDRHAVSPMYTPVTVQRIESNDDAHRFVTHEGHAYDISLGGARIELDQAPTIGEKLALHVQLPAGPQFFVTASVIWVNDETDDPGPRRFAVQFRNFVSERDREDLRRYLSDHPVRRAA
jgi:c-di-GMP-binding flagellar brake protein YcgR